MKRRASIPALAAVLAALLLGLLAGPAAAHHQEVLAPLPESAAEGWSGNFAIARAFVGEGVRHIFIGPDHILFVVGLLLLGGGLPRILKVVTAFTVAHSVTLVLATLRFLSPPASAVEPAIAASIVFVGVENLWVRRRAAVMSAAGAKGNARDYRPWMAFGFGLVHGFGFAGVLREMALPAQAFAWSLLSFNVGVELGRPASCSPPFPCWVRSAVGRRPVRPRSSRRARR